MQHTSKMNFTHAVSIILSAIAILMASTEVNAKPAPSGKKSESFEYTEIEPTFIVPQRNGLFENQNGEQILIIENSNKDVVGDSRFFYRPKGSQNFYQLNIVKDEKTATLINYSENGQISAETLTFDKASPEKREITFLELINQNKEYVRYNLIDSRTATTLLLDPGLKYFRLPTGYRDVHYSYETKMTKVPLKIVGRRFSQPSYQNLKLIFGRNRTREMDFESAVGAPGRYSELTTKNQNFIVSTKQFGQTIGTDETRLSINGFDKTPEPLVQLDHTATYQSSEDSAYKFFKAIYPQVGCGNLLK